ncbi:MAG: tetratricopeptide repeat protein [Chitinophagaceae bacterium]|nr:tetratricopeptide repeat protein [Chitinophagaceae bacterium]
MKLKYFLSFIACLFCVNFLFAKADNLDSAAFYLKKAQQFSKISKFIDADRSFQKAINFNPSNKDLNIAYGDYLLTQRKYFVAIEQYGNVLESNINHPVALQKLAEVSFLLRRWNDVVMYGKKLLQNDNKASVKYILGKSYYELENYGQSKVLLTEAVTENPEQVEAVTLLGKVLVELNDYKQAIAVYNKTLQLDPNNKQLIYELGLLYFSMNNEPEAIRYFELAAEKGYKTDLGYYENLGLAYLGTNIEKGVEILNKVLENKPGNSDILFQVAQAYFKVEKFQQAADTYYKVYENDPANSRALFMTGVAYQKKGDKSKGIAFCEQAIRMDPELAQLKTAKSIF